MVIRTLTAEDFDAVHAAFVEAFSDYIVKMAPPRDQFAETLTRRGYVPEASVAAIEDGRIVGVTLNAVDGAWAYDSGTGVIPSHRRRGLSRAMLQFIEPALRERGCTNYVLEVLEANRAARELYLSDGFVETRGLQCWTFESTTQRGVDSPREDVSPRRLEDLETRRLWWDITPSWQNSMASLRRARAPIAVLADDDAYAIVVPSTGDLAQLAVRPDMRRRGIGTRLLNEAAQIAGKPLRIMNVDDRNDGIARFLERAGAKKMIRQVEMVKPL